MLTPKMSVLLGIVAALCLVAGVQHLVIAQRDFEKEQKIKQLGQEYTAKKASQSKVPASMSQERMPAMLLDQEKKEVPAIEGPPAKKIAPAA